MRRYLLRLLISLDQLLNTLVGGDPDETISSRLGRLKRNCGGVIPWSHPVARILDWLLDRIDPNHTLDSIESNGNHENR